MKSFGKQKIDWTCATLSCNGKILFDNKNLIVHNGKIKNITTTNVRALGPTNANKGKFGVLHITDPSALITTGMICQTPPTIVSATSYVMGETDATIILTSLSDVVLTLPLAGIPNKVIQIRSCGTNTVTNTESNILNVYNQPPTNVVLDNTHTWIILQSNGTNWIPISRL